MRVGMPGEEPRANIARIMDDVWNTASFGVGRRNNEQVGHDLFDHVPTSNFEVQGPTSPPIATSVWVTFCESTETVFRSCTFLRRWAWPWRGRMNLIGITTKRTKTSYSVSLSGSAVSRPFVFFAMR
jgi:hypothetical protein